MQLFHFTFDRVKYISIFNIFSAHRMVDRFAKLFFIQFIAGRGTFYDATRYLRFSYNPFCWYFNCFVRSLCIHDIS